MQKTEKSKGPLEKSDMDVLRSHDPKVIHIYVKFPGERICEITLKSDANKATYADAKLASMLNERAIKPAGGLLEYPNSPIFIMCQSLKEKPKTKCFQVQMR
jgi:hypothetical protein